MQHARQHLRGPGHPRDDLGRYLRQSGLVSAKALLEAQNILARSRSSLDRILVAEGLLSAREMTTALSRFHGLPRVDLAAEPPDPGLAGRIALRTCLNHSVLPWRENDGVLRIAASRIEDFTHALGLLGEHAPRAELVLAPAGEIQAALARMHRDALTRQAAARPPAAESCRGWSRARGRRLALTLAGLALLLGLTWAAPTHVFAALALWATFTLFVAAGLRIAAFVARLSEPGPADRYGTDGDRGGTSSRPIPAPTPAPVAAPAAVPVGVPGAALPRVSVLVPLYKETQIARHLVRRLERLTYPKPLLDVVLVLEENDRLTRETIANCTLPPWMRVVEVPEGQPKTKPRAMNYALDFCDGEIVGIWDAEDAPAPDQIDRVAEAFARAPEDVACIQGVLDYYNSRQNWLARCFTVEYAAWFRMILPGMERLGLAIPLGGTTCFFRRDVLEEMGGWDAHNVTEDADLGFRMARHGYHTQVIETTTGEEANCRFWRWVRQRSRWLKGYMVTYLVHMRRPRLLYRQLGARRFWGFQAHFVTALSQFVLAPFLWSFWLVLLGLPHPLEAFFARELLVQFGLLFLMVEVISVLINAAAVAGPDHRHLLPWVPTLHLYYPLGAVAAYKALYELAVVPFYWDKTEHGHSLGHPRGNAGLASGVGAARIELEPGHESP